jgi:aminoglycoside phosphotransferase (APT) family kinase protein
MRTVKCLLDWEDAAIGDFRFDVVTAYWFMLYGVPHAAGRFLKEYERSTGRLVENLDGWLALLTLRGWAIAEVMRKQGQAIRLFEMEAEKEEAERRLAIAGF